VPYWYAVPGTSVQFISRLQAPFFDGPGSSDTIIFRCTDLNGLPLDPASDPVVTTSSPRAQVLKVSPTGSLPGTFKADIQVGRADANGVNVFTITADGAKVDVEIFVP